MNKKISNTTLLTVIIVVTIFSAALIVNLSASFKTFSEKNNAEIRSFYTQQQKELIKNEVKRLVTRIKVTKETVEKATKADLIEKVNSAISFLKHEHELNDSPESHLRHTEEMIASFNWGANGYFYLIARDGTVLHHGGNEAAKGRNVHSIKAKHPDLYEFFIKAIREGENYGVYRYYKPEDINNNKHSLADKIGYAKFDSESNILVGTGIYLDDFNSKIQNEIFNTLESARFGYNNYGYFMIFNSKHETVFHIDPALYETDNYNLKDVNGKYVVRDFVKIAKEKGTGYSNYYWRLPDSDKISEKITYLHYIPEWDWIVGSGFYFEDYFELIKSKEKISKNILAGETRKTLALIMILLGASLVTAIAIFKKIRRIEEDSEKYVNDLIQYKTVITKSSLVSVTDLEGNMTFVNDIMVDITGYSYDDLIGEKHSMLGHPDNPKDVYTELWDTISKGEIWKGILKNIKKDGGYFYQKTTIVPYKDKNGEIIKYIAISYDVTEVFENKTQLHHSLYSDSLTGLKNREQLLKDLGDTDSASLALIDIDGFHRINETFGMETGDKLLVRFAKILSSHRNLKGYEFYRLHSDVFAVLSNEHSIEDMRTNVNNTIQELSNEVIEIDEHNIILSVIIGFAHGKNDLLNFAETALQFAKTNNISEHLYDENDTSSSVHYEKNAKTVLMISKAIEEDRVVPFFQPIAGEAVADLKYETLMRIIEEDGRIVTPFEFLEVSKQTRFYPELTKIIVTKAIDEFAKNNYKFSINLSPEDILNSSTMDFIYDYAMSKGVMRRLILEIVESESMTSSEISANQLYRFKLSGAEVAIDDFGTGYSNFDYLLKIKADYVKIDGSIVKLITKDKRALEVVKSIVEYSKKLGMKTVAEFISDKSIQDKAKEVGVDYLQGYHIGKPEKFLQTEKKEVI